MSDNLDRIELPVAAGSLGVRDALRLIVGRGGGLVVAEAGRPARVLTAGDLLHSLRSGDEGPIETVLPQGSRGGPDEAASLTISPPQGAGALGPGQTALVSGLSMDQAVRLVTAVSLYVCTRNDTHVFMADELLHVGRCNLCGAPVNPL
jgi:hypothetical protein